MSGQQIGTVIGGIIGAYFGGPAGAQLGMAIGGAIGGAIDPTKINGPRIGDGQQQNATDGSPIAWVQGTAKVAGTIVQVGPRRDVKVKQSQDGGKGGPEVYTHEAHQDFAILVCESSEIRGSTIDNIVMVEQDGKIVYDIRNNQSLVEKWESMQGDGNWLIDMMAERFHNAAYESAKWKQGVDFLFGGEDQMPHPTMEAISGVGNTPAYRGSCMAIFKDFNLTAVGDRIPTFLFTVSSASADVPETVLTNVDTSLSDVPFWSVHDQSDVVGGFKDFALTGETDQVELSQLAPWAVYRVVLVPYYTGDTNPMQSVGWDTTEAMDNLQVPGAIYDSGWLGFNPQEAAADNAAGSTWQLLWQSKGIHAPTVGVGALNINIILSAPPGKRLIGVRVVNFYWFSTYDASDVTPHLLIPQSPGQTLTYLGNGHYIAADGTRYKTTWATGVNVQNVNGVPLSSIVSNICKRGGLQQSDIDVTALAGTQVLGYTIARQMTGVDALQPLLAAYFSYASDHDAKLWFQFYGSDTTVTVDGNDLLAGDDANGTPITSNLRNNATEFPLRFIGQYYDPDQNYMPVQVVRSRTARDVIAIGDQTFSIPVVMSASGATQATDKAMKVAYATLEGTLEYSVPFAGASQTYLGLTAGDPLQFDGKRWVVDEAILSQGYLKLTTRYDRQSAYTSNIQPIEGLPPVPPLSVYSGPTSMIAMNLPSLRQSDAYGAYIVAASAGQSASWRGCQIQLSLDNQASWNSVAQVTTAGVFGTLTAADTGTELDVLVNGELDSVTDSQLDAQANPFALVHDDANAEVGQFGTATEDSATPNKYALTNLRRGLLGTTQLTGAVGDQFVDLDSAVFVPIDIAFAGQTLYFRAVGFGETTTNAPVIAFTYLPDTTIIYNAGQAGT